MPEQPTSHQRHTYRTGMILLLLLIVAGVMALMASCTPTDAEVGAWAGVSTDEIRSGTGSTRTSTAPAAGFAPAAYKPSRTPFQPVTNTPTASPTPTATVPPTPTSTPTPMPTSTPDPLPDEAFVTGVTSYPQSLPLSCESRSAVDWARFFGVNIAELEFMYALPTSLNPNEGFVGSPYGWWGQIPPGDYGVHAPPVAALLRSYGLNAWERQGMDYDDLRREIAAGRPVIVWVIGSATYGSPANYTAPDGKTITVASREHTVMVTGYTPTAVRYYDQGLYFDITVERFLSSWGVLENMAIVLE